MAGSKKAEEAVVRSLALATPADGQVVTGVNVQADMAGIANIYKAIHREQVDDAIRAAVKASKAATAKVDEATKAWLGIDHTDRSAFPVPAETAAAAEALLAAVTAVAPKAALVYDTVLVAAEAGTYAVKASVVADRDNAVRFTSPAVPLTAGPAAAAAALVGAKAEAAAASARLAELRDEKAGIDDQADLVAAKILAGTLTSTETGRTMLEVIGAHARKRAAALELPPPADVATPSAPPAGA